MPPKSPDLIPLYFFQWGQLKSVVYKKQPDSLQKRTMQECRANKAAIHKVNEQFDWKSLTCNTVI